MINFRCASTMSSESVGKKRNAVGSLTSRRKSNSRNQSTIRRTLSWLIVKNWPSRKKRNEDAKNNRKRDKKHGLLRLKQRR